LADYHPDGDNYPHGNRHDYRHKRPDVTDKENGRLSREGLPSLYI